MKKMILLAAIAFFGLTANAQTAKKTTTKKAVKTAQVDGAGMVFETETIDYGTISRHSNGKREFLFTNSGNKPLIIEDVQSSCGCVIATKPQDPIFPGAKGVIGVTYDTQRRGPFTKTVTVKSNAIGRETIVLTIKGVVAPDVQAEEAAPVKN